MNPSKENAEYTVYVVSGSTQYDVTPALISIDRSEAKKEMAQGVTLKLANIESGGSRLSELFDDNARVRVIANDGEKKEEVFRGFVWTDGGNASIEDRTLTLKCYDNLIYLQESEASEFFSSGMTTEAIFSKICGDWGIKLEYNYESITHSKLALRGSLSDIMTTDVLDLVKDRTGKGYTVISEKDVMKVKPVGDNTVIYQITAGDNAISTTTERTKNGMVTQVVILGTADNDEREPVERTIKGDISKYGTLQKIVRRDTNTTLTDAYAEGQSIIDKDGSPKWSYLVKAPDIPWIRKGDTVYVDAGDIKQQYLIVDDIDRTIDSVKNQMTLILSRVSAVTVKVKRIISESESNPVFLRDLDSGFYVLEGYFAFDYYKYYFMPREPRTKIILFRHTKVKPTNGRYVLYNNYFHYDHPLNDKEKEQEVNLYVDSTEFLVHIIKEPSVSYVNVYDNNRYCVWYNVFSDHGEVFSNLNGGGYVSTEYPEWSYYIREGHRDDKWYYSESLNRINPRFKSHDLSYLPNDIKNTYLK